MGFWERHLTSKSEKQARVIVRQGEALLDHGLGTAPGGRYLLAVSDAALYVIFLNGLMDVTRLPYEAIASVELRNDLLLVTARSGSRLGITMSPQAGRLHAVLAGRLLEHAPRLVS